MGYYVVSVSLFVYKHVYVYIHMYTHIHVFMCTYIQSCNLICVSNNTLYVSNSLNNAFRIGILHLSLYFSMNMYKWNSLILFP